VELKMALHQTNRREFMKLMGMLPLAARFCAAQSAPAKLAAPGVWFLLGEASKGYCNNVLIEMNDYLILVDANYPGRAHELVQLIPTLSPKPLRWVFDTHAHRDHSYGNSIWTRAGATTLAYKGVVDEMNRWEPARWNATMAVREDVRATGETDVERPKKTFSGPRFTLRDAGPNGRVVEFLFMGWAHTPGDGFVWLPHERVLCTGDAAVNGPRNKLMDGWLANWPKVMDRVLALRPVHVLPGHGDSGGPEILTGQRDFLVDLLASVKAQAAQGVKPEAMHVQLNGPQASWAPSGASAWQLDIDTAYLEISTHKAAGANPHVWK
jgi:glyoxylase-like metal-dependent hydrolase (beta-lactamase superfamily II)